VSKKCQAASNLYVWWIGLIQKEEPGFEHKHPTYP